MGEIMTFWQFIEAMRLEDIRLKRKGETGTDRSGVIIWAAKIFDAANGSKFEEQWNYILKNGVPK